MSPRRLSAFLPLLLTLGFLSGCATADPQSGSGGRTAMLDAIRVEPLGDYYIGRRYYKVDYKFWGFVRRPREPWSKAKMVMLNENQKLAPDREQGTIGADNNSEYRLIGGFSGATVYEPASNGFYPEFVLKNYELRSANPASIFRSPGATDPKRRVIAKPY